MQDYNDLLERLARCTRSPRGRFSAENSWPLLERRIRPGRRVWTLWRWIGSCAAIFLLVIGGWLLRDSIGSENWQEIRTEADIRRVELPDKSLVVLNRYSSISYPQDLEKEDKREVRLEGGAYFEVSKSAEHPFLVRAGEVQVQVLGTHFEVEAYPQDTLVSTFLLEGKVSVSTPQGDVYLSPRERAIYHTGRKDLRTYADQVLEEVDWISGELRFDQVPMREVMRRLSHTFHTDIRIEDDSLADYRVRARFTHKEELEDILYLLQNITPFDYTYRNDQIILTHK